MSSQDSAQPATSFVLRDPETFFRAQKRNRRATWRMSALGVFAAIIMGVPLTLALTPLLYAVTLAGAEIVNRFSPLPADFWQAINGIARLGQRVGDYFLNHKGTLDPQQLAWALCLFLLPGIVVTLLLWLCMLVLFRRGGVGGALASLNAREPNAGDLKELQLADTAQEMAIAAGLPGPKLMLVDSPGANAAAIGTSAHDARIVISRRLLDDLSRDQLQAVLAHLISSIGNGDLHVAFTVTSVFETCGLLVTLINSPFGRQSQKTLWRIVRYSFLGSKGDTAKSAEADAVAELLAGSLDMSSSDIDRFFNSPQKVGLIRKLLRLVFFPIVFTNMAIEITLWFFLNLLLGPCMALVWRTRRYLADAGAVELTRNPDALAGALERLSQDSSAIPGGSWATHLFVINPTGDRSLGGTRPTPEQMKQAAAIWAASQPEAQAKVPPVADYQSLKREMMTTGMAAFRGDAQAAARVQAFAQAMAAAHGEDAASVHIPNVTDIAAAARGDRAAIDRIHSATRQNAQLQAKGGSTGLQSQSFLSFHPPLKKRLRRLERMGAQFRAEAHTRMGAGAKIFAAILWLIIGPLLAVAAGLMLMVIVMIIGLNLVLLALWLAVIHWAFAQNWTENFYGFMRFVNDVTTALGKAGRSR
jgi:Zn-dependent protease with chaperone function